MKRILLALYLTGKNVLTLLVDVLNVMLRFQQCVPYVNLGAFQLMENALVRVVKSFLKHNVLTK